MKRRSGVGKITLTVASIIIGASFVIGNGIIKPRFERLVRDYKLEKIRKELELPQWVRDSAEGLLNVYNAEQSHLSFGPSDCEYYLDAVMSDFKVHYKKLGDGSHYIQFDSKDCTGGDSLSLCKSTVLLVNPEGNPSRVSEGNSVMSDTCGSHMPALIMEPRGTGLQIYHYQFPGLGLDVHYPSMRLPEAYLGVARMVLDDISD